MRVLVLALLLAGCATRLLDPTDGGGASLDGPSRDGSTDLAQPPQDLAGRQVCGGFGGISCPSRQYCEFPDGSCGSADQTGICLDQPKDCVSPAPGQVCGCDGKTYSTDCARQAAGIALKHTGPC
jgi:hypothetical protein